MPAPHPAVIRRAPRHREIEVLTRQHLHRLPAIRREPVIQHRDDPFLENARLENPAIEKNRRRVNERAPRDLHRRVRRLGHRPRLPRKKRRQMPRDPRVLRIRQRHLREARAARGLRQFRHRSLREKSIHQHALGILARQLGAQRPADQRGTAARHRDRNLRELGPVEQFLLPLPAAERQRVELPLIQLLALGDEPLVQRVRQREVHVVAAEQDVIAHRHARELHLALLFRDRNEGKIRRAAADIDHEDHVAHADVFAETFPRRLDPRVERGLRFLQQRHVRQPRLHRRLQGQIARRRIKRRGHRDHDLLRRQRLLPLPARRRVPVIPRPAQMRQIPRRRLERRHLRHVRRRLPRQQRTAAVHARMTQPALRRRHQPRRHLAAVTAGKLADHLRRVLLPRQRQTARREFLRIGQIQKRRQQRLLLDRPHARELRNLQHRLLDRAPALLREVQIRERAMRGAEVDADGVGGFFRCRFQSVSQGKKFSAE